MLFWLVDGVVLSIVEIWVLGQWTKNNEEIVCLRCSSMDAMTQNIHRIGAFLPKIPIAPCYCQMMG